MVRGVKIIFEFAHLLYLLKKKIQINTNKIYSKLANFFDTNQKWGQKWCLLYTLHVLDLLIFCALKTCHKIVIISKLDEIYSFIIYFSIHYKSLFIKYVISILGIWCWYKDINHKLFINKKFIHSYEWNRHFII